MIDYYLSPICDGRKSYYHKALVIEKDNGEKILKSYDTEVIKITPDNKVIRLWNDYSATTMRHINSFLRLFNIPGGGKKWWLDLPVEE